MKIATTNTPKKDTHRTFKVHGKDYVFEAVQDKDENTHFVAEVKDEVHAEVFMKHGAFYAYGAENEPKSMLQRGSGDSTIVASPAPPLISLHKQDALDAATELLKGSANEISTLIGKSNREIISAAFDTESANAKPRKNVIALLQLTLDSMPQAGSGK